LPRRRAFQQIYEEGWHGRDPSRLQIGHPAEDVAVNSRIGDRDAASEQKRGLQRSFKRLRIIERRGAKRAVIGRQN
jgi:hypothetical protein